MPATAPADQSAERRLKRPRTEVDAPEIKDDIFWIKGDFTIISSDHIRFRVDHHYLLSARYVFHPS